MQSFHTSFSTSGNAVKLEISRMEFFLPQQPPFHRWKIDVHPLVRARVRTQQYRFYPKRKERAGDFHRKAKALNV